MCVREREEMGLRLNSMRNFTSSKRRGEGTEDGEKKKKEEGHIMGVNNQILRPSDLEENP